jgi:hypothetical protein
VKDSSNGGWSLLSGCFREGCFRCNKEGRMVVYVDSVEVLRQKLIDDYVYLVKHPDWLNKQEKDFIDQINKRFGVEKE